MTPQRVCLVGPSLQGNLALEYLEASLEARGHHARMVRFEKTDDAQGCVRSIMSFGPILVGLSMTFQCTLDENLALARLLRKAGFSGHITCGGHVPTFCWDELLAEAPEIDSVVRHEGEQTLTELVEALGRGESPRDIAGLVWRGDGVISAGPARPLLSDLEKLPRPLRRSEPLVVGGAPIAVMLTSRGCVGECSYCCLRAFGKDAGGKRFRLRDPNAVADEIADAYHELGVRVVIVQDDLFILTSEKKSIERMEAIARGIKERGVEKVLFWIKGRPETITAPVAEAAREMGAIHMFLGVENASPNRLRYLGRTHTGDDSARAIDICLQNKIRSSFNFMLFDPDCTIEEIEHNLDFAEQYLNLTWNVCRTEIYPGTPMLDKLKHEGRLKGDWRSYGYEMNDPRAEIMFRILRICFDKRAFHNESLLNRLINLSFARHVHEELLAGPATDVLSRDVDGLVRAVYRDTVDELRRVARFASKTEIDDIDGLRDFAINTAMAINERDHLWTNELDRLAFLLDARGEKIRKNRASN